MTPRMHSTESELVRRWIETPTPRPSTTTRYGAAARPAADGVEAFDWEDLVDRSDLRRQALALELGASFDGFPGVHASPGGGSRAFHR